MLLLRIAFVIASLILAGVALLILTAGKIQAAPGSNSWPLASPDGRCKISVSLADGTVNYQVSRAGKIIIQKSPLGLRRDDQDFAHSLVFDHAGKIEKRREQYELFAGTRPKVDHILNHLSLTFLNSNHAPIEIELAAGNEGVAFRYRFAQTSNEVRIVESEASGFTLPPTSSLV